MSAYWWKITRMFLLGPGSRQDEGSQGMGASFLVQARSFWRTIWRPDSLSEDEPAGQLYGPSTPVPGEIPKIGVPQVKAGGASTSRGGQKIHGVG